MKGKSRSPYEEVVRLKNILLNVLSDLKLVERELEHLEDQLAPSRQDKPVK